MSPSRILMLRAAKDQDLEGTIGSHLFSCCTPGAAGMDIVEPVTTCGVAFPCLLEAGVPILMSYWVELAICATGVGEARGCCHGHC